MPASYKSEIVNFETASKFLGMKDERLLPRCKNLRICRESGNIVVRLYGSTIATFFQDGTVDYSCQSQYRNSKTTKRHRAAFGGPWEI